MFEGLERHGFGNWNEIAEHIGTDKTKEEVERHYEDVYLSSENFMPTQRETLSKRDEKTLRLTTPRVARTDVRRGRRAREP